MNLKTEQEIERLEEIRLNAIANLDYRAAIDAVRAQKKLIRDLISEVDAKIEQHRLALLPGDVPAFSLPEN